MPLSPAFAPGRAPRLLAQSPGQPRALAVALLLALALPLSVTLAAPLAMAQTAPGPLGEPPAQTTPTAPTPAPTATPTPLSTPPTTTPATPATLDLCDPQTLQTQLQNTGTLRAGQLAACQDRADWLAVLGRWQLAQGRYDEALEHLERALLMEPARLSTQLDFAIALAGAGDTLSALQLAQQLQQDTELPAPLREALQARVRQWQDPVARSLGPLEQSRWQYQLGSRLGYDSNLLGAPNLQSITLNLFGLPVSLPLDDSYTRQPGHYVRHDLSVGYQRRSADQLLQALASASQRNTPGLPAGQLQQVTAQAGLSQAAPSAWQWSPDSRIYLQGQLASLHSGGGSRGRHHTAGLSAGLDTPWGPPPAALAPEAWACQQRHGLEWLRRNTSGSALLNGRYTGLNSQWTCQDQQPAGPSRQGLLALRLGQDTPVYAERPGGTQHQASLRLAWQQDLRRWQLQAEAEVDTSLDQRVYSDILAEGVRRRLQRQAVRLQLQVPLAPSLQLQLGTEWLHQRSNIALFSVRSWGPFAGLRWTP